jgi:AcrR family transcriptional regulator
MRNVAAPNQLPTDPLEDRGRAPAAYRRYASQPMLDRKRRILTEAQNLIEEVGVEGFTIRELSARALVAPRTLYNSFGTREEIIGAAIEHYYDVFLQNLPPPPAPEDIPAVIARLGEMADRIIGLRRYSAAIVSVFFSPGLDARIHESILRISRVGTGRWLLTAEEAQILKPLGAAKREAVARLAVNGGYANVVDWVAGRISDQEFKRRSQINIFLVSFACLRPKHRHAVGKLIDQILAG